LRHRCENWECIKRHTENASMFSHLNEIMTPFSPWFIADYYWGDEILKVFGPDDQISSQLHARGLKQLLNCSDVSKFAVIFVQTDNLNAWFEACLPILATKVILITGKWYLPQIVPSRVTESILCNPKIILWASQNPIYENQTKYAAIPYGLVHTNVIDVMTTARRQFKRKQNMLAHLGLQETNPSRASLPHVERMPLSTYSAT